MPGGQDPTMAGRSHGAQNIVQRMWRPVQVGAARARVPPSMQSNVFKPVAFKFSPEGDGDEEAEGDGRRDDGGKWSMLIWSRVGGEYFSFVLFRIVLDLGTRVCCNGLC